MDRWTAIPLVSVGNISFGMARAEVREKIGHFCGELRKSKYSKNTFDDFGFCHVFYDTNDLAQAIEIFDAIEVEVDGAIVFPGDISQCMAVFHDLQHKDDGYVSADSSVGICASGKRTESILFAASGYYNA